MPNIEAIGRVWRDFESDLVERKEAATDRKKIAEAICAYSNDIRNSGSTGYVLVGLKDDGSCANLPITDELLLNLANLRDQGAILPLPRMSVDVVEIDGCIFIAIEVQPHPNPPIRFEGRTWIRVGPRRAIATADEERMLAERQRANVHSYDQLNVPGASFADLNLERFSKEYLAQAVSRDVLATDQRPVKDQLRALRLLSSSGDPNLASVLALCDDPRQFVPGAYIQFVRYSGTEITDPIADEKEVSGPLAEMLLEIDDVAKSHITQSVEFAGRPREMAEPRYAFPAIQQLVRNAVMHRNYESSNSPIRMYWFDDRIEIHNAGGLFGQMNEANFGKAGVTDYRNPLLAEVMKTLGFVQRFGAGIHTAIRASEENGSPRPEFQFSPAAFVAILRSR